MALPYAAEAPLVVGLGEPKLADVFAVVCGGRPVAIDAAVAQRVKKESPPPKQFQAEETPSGRDQSADSELLSSIAVQLISPASLASLIIEPSLL